VQDGIHPEYVETTISCICGNVVHTRSTVPDVHVEVCAKCHPFYTGKRQSLLDRGGRVDQFNKRYNIKRETSDPAAEEATAEEATPAEAVPVEEATEA
jgi:large subunit ribosomal protein L31